MTAPVHCRRTAYEQFLAALPDIESTPGLLQASIAISKHELEDADVTEVEAFLSEVARTVQSRVRSRQPKVVVAHLHDVFFDELGFTGDREEYYAPWNSYPTKVIERRKGIPITLGLLYKCVAEQLGLAVDGLNSPGHFLLAVETETKPMLVDAFEGGRVLTEDEALSLIDQTVGRRVPRTDQIFDIATHRQWIARILNNLQNAFALANRRDDIAAMQELMTLLADTRHEQR